MLDAVTIDPKCIIGDCLESGFGLNVYMQIMRAVSEEGFTATKEFRKQFNGYYKVRQKSQEWYDKYYELMENQKTKPKSYEKILYELYPVKQTIEASFASKLIATIDPKYPIWDKYVLQNLGLDSEWERNRSESHEKRITKAVEIYDQIQSFYTKFESSDKGRECIAVLDKALPMYANKLSNTKKIDFILWSKRNENAKQ